jgi:hypothetical protein
VSSIITKVDAMPDETANREPSRTASIPVRPSNCVALLALAISFCIISTLGVWLLYWSWRAVSVQMATGRCTVFVGVMAGVHFIGYRLWRRQFVQDPGNGGKSLSRQFSSAYWPPVKAALLQQGITAILALLVLDGGLTFHVTMIAIVAYWLAFCIVIVRRPDSPTRGDLRLVRYGFLMVFLIVIVAGPMVWRALGRI